MSDAPNFAEMNETDVREEIIRPLLHRLGYRRGTENNIRTELTLRYPRQFLGRKSPKHDPVLRGRADYICEVIPYARWVVEAKSPEAELSVDDVEQAHSYATHPEVGAFYSLLTNGRCFRLYATTNPSVPVLEWNFNETDSRWIEISNVLNPTAIKRLSSLILPVPGKPLAGGLRPVIEIVGGHVTYTEHVSDLPAIQERLTVMRGLRSTVVGERVQRNQEGIIEIRLRLAGAFTHMDELNRAAGIDVYTFSTADEFISDDPSRPTIFQGIVQGRIPIGTKVMPPFAPTETIIPFATNMTAFTQATGFVEGGRCKGTFIMEYHNQFDVSGPMRAAIEKVMPLEQEHRAYGDFEIVGNDTA